MSQNDRFIRSVSLQQEPSEVELDLQSRQADFEQRRRVIATRFALGVAASILTVGTVIAAIRFSPLGSYLNGWVEDQGAKVARSFDAPSFKPDKDAQAELMKTRDWGGHQILLRKDANLGDNVIGVLRPGLAVVAIRGTGNLYASTGDEVKGDDGEKYGLWDQILGDVQVYDVVGGQYFPKKDENGKPVVASNPVVAAHFLEGIDK